MSGWKTIFEPEARRRILKRLEALDPASPACWGKMTAPQMVAHLTDQMRHALRLSPVAAQAGPLRWGWVRWTSIYLVSWPKGRIQGPPEAFVTVPLSWSEDVAELVSLVNRFQKRGPDADWPEHALFGPMSGRDWGVFVHKHFDHHLRQFSG